MTPVADQYGSAADLSEDGPTDAIVLIRPTSILGEWDAGTDTDPIPPRAWLLGKVFCRKFISSIYGAGGVGKTALRYVQYLSMAAGRPLTGDHVFERCRVLVISLEDDKDELRRRIEAAKIHYRIKNEDIEGYLILAAPGGAAGRLVEKDENGKLKRGLLVDAIRQVVRTRKIDVVALDPFVKSHGVDENNNSDVDFAMQTLASLAIELNIAIDVPHHVRKGQQQHGNADSGRGASAQKDAGRLVYTLTTMTSEEARIIGVSEMERRSLIRIDSAKVNIAPPLTEARWFKLIAVPLGNGDNGLYPAGDEVQTVERWRWPGVWSDVSHAEINVILDEIDAGLSDGRRYSNAPNAADRAAWKVVTKHAPHKNEEQARLMINRWVENGVVNINDYYNERARKTEKGLYVVEANRPS